GCGIPTEFANIKEGNSLLDLGSGAGNDCFVARSFVGDSGQVTGLDFTDEMVEKANANKEKLGYKNISFIKGDIENMPFENDNFDVVISNCVLNLVPDKKKAFTEINRVLKAGGHFCISDVVLEGELPLKLQMAGEMYAGCVAGALQKTEYLDIINACGFKETTVHTEKLHVIPDNLLLNFISQDELDAYKKSGNGIYSITVSAKK
ncbi:arsenite methyltransferase, partial [Bacteroidota bacterium]